MPEDHVSLHVTRSIRGLILVNLDNQAQGFASLVEAYEALARLKGRSDRIYTRPALQRLLIGLEQEGRDQDAARYRNNLYPQ